jgi:hypothetical protein
LVVSGIFCIFAVTKIKDFNMEFELYQVFSTDENNKLVVDDVDTLDEAKELYESKDGFLLLGVDAPTAFDVIYARPYGMRLLS